MMLNKYVHEMCSVISYKNTKTFVKIAIGTSEFPILFRQRLNGITKQNDLPLKIFQNNFFNILYPILTLISMKKPYFSQLLRQNYFIFNKKCDKKYSLKSGIKLLFFCICF